MEQNVPVLPKKVWRLLRVLYFMLRKNISKSKLLLDLNKMIKRHKIANKHNIQHTEDLDIMAVNAAVFKAMEMIRSETASPALPGFGRSPAARQLRVTDSPFPLSSVDEDSHVDEAAEQFISRFYNDLRRENVTLFRSSY